MGVEFCSVLLTTFVDMPVKQSVLFMDAFCNVTIQLSRYTTRLLDVWCRRPLLLYNPKWVWSNEWGRHIGLATRLSFLFPLHTAARTRSVHWSRYCVQLFQQKRSEIVQHFFQWRDAWRRREGKKNLGDGGDGDDGNGDGGDGGGDETHGRTIQWAQRLTWKYVTALHDPLFQFGKQFPHITLQPWAHVVHTGQDELETVSLETARV